MKKTLEGSIKVIARTIETRDPYTAGHQERVAQLAQAIAVELGLDEIRIEGLGFGGLIHDIGKISVPAELLSTPRRLRPLEMELIRGHAQVGYDIIKDIDFPWPRRIAGLTAAPRARNPRPLQRGRVGDRPAESIGIER